MTTYTDAVAEARHLVKRSEQDQWRLAELTWEQVEAGKSRAEWARDVGVNRRSTARWYAIWEKFGTSVPRPTFTEACDLITGRADQIEEHGSQYQANARQRKLLPPDLKAIADFYLGVQKTRQRAAAEMERQADDMVMKLVKLRRGQRGS